jgi:large subunit ribosomal protein L29
MKAEKTEKFRDLSVAELEHKRHDLEERIFRVRFQAATTQGEGLTSLHALKLERARVATILREKHPAGTPAGKPAGEKDK